MTPPSDPLDPPAKPGSGHWSGLDPAGILIAPGMLGLAWLLMVVVFTVRQQPGIICLTPVFWLASFVVGPGVINFSRSRQTAALRREAALAGALFGLLVGLIFLVDTLIVGLSDPDGISFAVAAGLGCMLFGAGLCALVSLGMAVLTMRRLGLEE